MKRKCIRNVLPLSLLLALILTLSACSFKVETGWHGRTGRDDRTQTELVTAQKRLAKAQGAY